MTDLGYSVCLSLLQLILTIMAVVFPVMFWYGLKEVFSDQETDF